MLTQKRFGIGTCQIPVSFQKNKLNYLFTHDLLKTLVALMDWPNGSTSTHIERGKKRNRKKIFGWFWQLWEEPLFIMQCKLKLDTY
jgi:hypothetical protein